MDAQHESELPANAMSVDVEDYYQVSAFEGVVKRSSWHQYESRVERNMDRVLELFARHDSKATFFVLGCVAERFPHIVRQIVSQDHELASHGFDHTRATEQTRQQFAADVMRTRKTLEDIGGVPVLGYRAASFSVNEQNPWVHDVLREGGYAYSSSVFPIAHDLYGMPQAMRFAHRVQPSGMLELPLTTVRMLGRNWPCAGGGYFRLAPYVVYRWALRRMNQRERQPAIFYFHPWEIDPDQPRVAGASRKSRFRHYLNLHRVETRLDRLLEDFRWDRIDRVFLSERSVSGATTSSLPACAF